MLATSGTALPECPNASLAAAPAGESSSSPHQRFLRQGRAPQARRRAVATTSASIPKPARPNSRCSGPSRVVPESALRRRGIFACSQASIAQKGALFVFDFPAPRMMGDGGMLGKAATAPNMASISVNLRIADRVIDPGNCAAKCLGRRWGGSRFYGRRFAGVARSTPRLGLLTKAGCT